MSISENIESGIKNSDLSPVMHYLNTCDSEISDAVERIITNGNTKSSEKYNAMLAVAFCKRKGKEIFSPNTDNLYNNFVQGLTPLT